MVVVTTCISVIHFSIFDLIFSFNMDRCIFLCVTSAYSWSWYSDAIVWGPLFVEMRLCMLPHCNVFSFVP